MNAFTSGISTYGKVLLQSAPELLSLGIGRVVDGQVATLGNDLLSSERALGVSPARVGPPVLDGLHILRILAVLILEETHGDDDDDFLG